MASRVDRGTDRPGFMLVCWVLPRSLVEQQSINFGAGTCTALAFFHLGIGMACSTTVHEDPDKTAALPSSYPANLSVTRMRRGLFLVYSGFLVLVYLGLV